MLRCALFLVLSLSCSAVPAVARPNTDPDAARLVVEDLPRFWSAWEAARSATSPGERAAIYQRDYLAPGSAGLRAFTELRIEDAASLVAAIDAHPDYYRRLRASTDRVGEFEPQIRASLRRMKRIHPEAVFPDVYFLVGRMNSGGTLTDTGLLIGLDMFGRDEGIAMDELGEWHRAVLGSMQGLPHIVAHELVHYQQHYPSADAPTLLRMSINEGVADFLAELASGRHINAHVHAWAEPRAAALWAEFQGVMHGHETAGWLYGAPAEQGRPSDLGYWMGYRIARAYYRRNPDKQAAVRDMLAITDFEDFLRRSGVAGEFAAAQAPGQDAGASDAAR